MWAVAAIHPDDRERHYPFPSKADAERALAELEASEWVPEPACTCCEMQTVTIGDQVLIRYQIEDLAVVELTAPGSPPQGP